MTDPAPSHLGELPDSLAGRVVALTAEVLPDVVRLPPALRRVAAFAPARRSRLGGTAIREALAADDTFRERVATQLGSRVVDEQDIAGRTALVWLARPEGWEDAVADGVRRLAERPSAPHPTSDQLERVRERLTAAEQSLRDLKAEHRSQLDELKSENIALRRKLGESRTREREARASGEQWEQAARESRLRAETLASAQDKELRRLRAQVAQGESAATADRTADRRAVRAGREEATVRARLLLDTVIEAAAGLRRELALPPVTGAPGDRVEADVEETGARASAAPRGARGDAGPALLEQYLAMPRARLIVDGYNVSMTAWPTSSLEAQRIRLLGALAPLVARTGIETTVVFDAASSSTRPVVPVPRGVKVLFSPEGVIADDVIRDLVAAEPEGRVLVVVTSDQALVDHVVRDGARPVGAAVLVALLNRPG